MRGLVLAVWLLPALAGAQPVSEPIVDRDFVLDAHLGAVLGSYRLVGMGGTALATAEGAAYLASNPAAVAVRPVTANRWFEWDWTLDVYEPRLGEDFDNNGVPQSETDLATEVNGGVGIMGWWGGWGYGMVFSGETRHFTLDDGTPAKLESSLVRLVAGTTVRGGRLALGGALIGSGARVATAADDQSLVEVPGLALELGAVWKPPERSWRAGVRTLVPLLSAIDTLACDPLDCGGYILPRDVKVPWNLGAGVAWRRGPTPWNRRVFDDWRDERALTVAADVVITGLVEDGAGVEAFLAKRLQPSGREVSLSLRAGVDYEWEPGWFRVRGGSYWEPGRFAGVGGRLHLTAGFDLRLWSFCFWDRRRRLRLSVATDVASGYTNAVTSLGFWH